MHICTIQQVQSCFLVQLCLMSVLHVHCSEFDLSANRRTPQPVITAGHMCSMQGFDEYYLRKTCVTWEPKWDWVPKPKPQKPLPWWSTSSHRWLKSPIGEILPWRRAKLDPLPTPNKSQGTSKIFSKIFSYDPGLNLFYVIFWFIR